jgi:predicted small lipoprotein YifL
VAALSLAACGVKGDLEPHPAARLAGADAAPGGASGESSTKVFTSQSRVEHVGTPNILPTMPPKQWTKDSKSAKDGKSEKDANSSGPEQRAKTGAPDKPFVLDWLL